MAGVTQAKLEKLPEQCTEILRDIAEIAQIDNVDDGGDNDDESDFMHICEYVRAGVVLLSAESLTAAAPDPAENKNLFGTGQQTVH